MGAPSFCRLRKRGTVTLTQSDILRLLSWMKKPLDRLYGRHRFYAAVISHAVWLYCRFALSL
jgi:hypothetical protein